MMALLAGGILSLWVRWNVGGLITEESMPSLAMILLGLIVLVFLGGLVATVVFQESNRFFRPMKGGHQHISNGAIC